VYSVMFSHGFTRTIRNKDYAWDLVLIVLQVREIPEENLGLDFHGLIGSKMTKTISWDHTLMVYLA
jgi:hypothetical protein